MTKLFIWIACRACIKRYVYAHLIACALSYQNVMIPRVTSYSGLDHVNNVQFVCVCVRVRVREREMPRDLWDCSI